MTNVKKSRNADLSRREALKRLGLAVGAAYMTPTLFLLSNAQASSSVSGGSDDSSDSDDSSGSGSGGGSGGGGSSGGGGTSSASSASTSAPSSAPSTSVEDSEFSGDPTPADGILSSDEELWLIKNGWQKAEGI